MDLAEKKNKRKAMITSLVIHALLLLLFLFFGLTTIHPKPEEGMMINFGNTESGLGDTESDPAQSEVVEEQVEEEVQPAESVDKIRRPRRRHSAAPFSTSRVHSPRSWVTNHHHHSCIHCQVTLG